MGKGNYEYYEKNREGCLLSSFVPAHTLIPLVEKMIPCPFCDLEKSQSKSEFLIMHIEIVHPDELSKLKQFFPILRSYLGK